MSNPNNHNTSANSEEFIRLATQMEEREKAESRLHDQIHEVKKDFNDRMDRLEKHLQRTATTAVTVTIIVVSIIVKFL